jgi:hypothetical protein
MNLFLLEIIKNDKPKKLISSFAAWQEGHLKAIGLSSPVMSPEWPFRKDL